MWKLTDLGIGVEGRAGVSRPGMVQKGAGAIFGVCAVVYDLYAISLSGSDHKQRKFKGKIMDREKMLLQGGDFWYRG